METYKLNTKQATNLMNKFSGLIGISGISSDMRALEDVMDTNDRARLTIEMFSYRVLKYIGAYAAALNGLDAVVFTGGIGTNGPPVRRLVCDRLKFLGVEIDEAINQRAVGNKTLCLSTPESKVSVWAYLTNEELVIAQQTVEVVSAAN
jgi:acetate kinase